MGGDREGARGRGPRPPPGKLLPDEVVWIRTRMSDEEFFNFHFLHVAYFLKLTDYTDAQADLRLCSTKSSFSQQGTYRMG